MDDKCCTYSAQWYDWYEMTEDPLWFQTEIDHPVLPWWLRRVSAEEINWFVQTYPTLAPYYPVTSVGETDWLAPYYTYWWP